MASLFARRPGGAGLLDRSSAPLPDRRRSRGSISGRPAGVEHRRRGALASRLHSSADPMRGSWRRSNVPSRPIPRLRRHTSTRRRSASGFEGQAGALRYADRLPGSRADGQERRRYSPRPCPVDVRSPGRLLARRGKLARQCVGEHSLRRVSHVLAGFPIPQRSRFGWPATWPRGDPARGPGVSLQTAVTTSPDSSFAEATCARHAPSSGIRWSPA